MLSTVVLTNKRGFDEIDITEADKSRTIKHRLNGDFAAQRNFALTQVKGDWILFLDSDEQLQHELVTIPEGYDAFYLKRLDHFFGKVLRHGETGNIKLLRLAKKDFGSWRGKVHEVWEGKGITGILDIPIEHFPHQTIQEFISEINVYTTIRAKELTVKFNIFEAILKPTGKFLDNYIFKLGFLDGLAGFVMAYMMSLHSLIVRVKHYENTHTH